jgi:hypothetical protein
VIVIDIYLSRQQLVRLAYHMTQLTYGFKIDLLILKHQHPCNRICGVMVSVFDLIEVDRGLELRSGQTKDYKFVFVVFPLSTQH